MCTLVFCLAALIEVWFKHNGVTPVGQRLDEGAQTEKQRVTNHLFGTLRPLRRSWGVLYGLLWDLQWAEKEKRNQLIQCTWGQWVLSISWLCDTSANKTFSEVTDKGDLLWGFVSIQCAGYSLFITVEECLLVLAFFYWLPVHFRMVFKVLSSAYESLNGLTQNTVDIVSWYNPAHTFRSCVRSLLTVMDFSTEERRTELLKGHRLRKNPAQGNKAGWKLPWMYI